MRNVFQWFRFRSKLQCCGNCGTVFQILLNLSNKTRFFSGWIQIDTSFTNRPMDWSHFNCGSGLIVGGLLPDMWSTADLLAVLDVAHFGQFGYMCPTSVTANIWSTTFVVHLNLHFSAFRTCASIIYWGVISTARTFPRNQEGFEWIHKQTPWRRICTSKYVSQLKACQVAFRKSVHCEHYCR